MCRKKQPKEIRFSKEHMEHIVPGVLNTAKELLNLAKSNENDVIKKVASLGNRISAVIITTQCIEWLLKYKIQLEGKKIEPIHDLDKLFKTLEDEAQSEISKKFEENKTLLSFPLREGWDNIESIFQKADNAFVSWRYAVTTNDKKRRDISPVALYAAAISVYETLLIGDPQNITADTIKVAFELKG